MVRTVAALLFSSAASAQHTPGQDVCTDCAGCYWVHNMHCDANANRDACLQDQSRWCPDEASPAPTPASTQDVCTDCTGCFWVHNNYCDPHAYQQDCVHDRWCGGGAAPGQGASGQGGHAAPSPAPTPASTQDVCTGCAGCYWVHNMHCDARANRDACLADHSRWCPDAAAPGQASPAPTPPVCTDAPGFHIKDCPQCTCSWLAAGKCATFGAHQSAQRNPSTGRWWKGTEACCACQGPSSPVPTPAPTVRVAPNGGVTGCADKVDGQGSAFHIKDCPFCTCAWMAQPMGQEPNRCRAYGKYTGAIRDAQHQGVLKAGDACCICGGGQQ